ncbi:T9SS type B sorting domain-containing protein [Pseudotenacibaculum sp. MALMAid0570]|uniref:T9SS type B sorting domain-containing protein n=1 Tax=Pseudotenacibaculum sp. MALMAid0570 TaxID=3143938 RepID=UPI0032DEDCBA
MRNSPPKYSCALLFCLLILQIASGQLSKKHYIPPLTYAEFGNAQPQDQYIYISTPNNLNVTYTVRPIGQPQSSIITGTVTNTTPEEIFIGTVNSQLFQPSTQTSTVISNKGYIIESEDVIYVSVRMRAGNNAQAGALVSKGIAALGTIFRTGSFTNENPQSNYLNFFSFMATENNTTVVIDDLPPGISIKNYTGTFPITVTLNEGESYIVATNSNESTINRDGLIGTLIESDRPIVVNSGSANGSFHNGNGRDYGIDQIVDFSKVGNEYIFVRGDGSNNFENILLVAHEDNTSISINGGSSIATINAGEWHLIEGNYYNTNGNMYVNTSKNVFAYQGVGGNGNSEANQGMFFVPPLSCNNRGDLNSIANIRNIGNNIYNGGITIVTNKGSDVTINEQPIANYNTTGPFDVDGNPDYVTYKVLGLNNNVSVLSSGELYCAYFNYNGVATSGSFYSGFPTPPEIDFNLDLTAAGNCIPNITLEAFNTDVFDLIEWYYDNGNGFVPTGETTSTFKPLEPGGYKLVGTITCSGLTFDSPAVRVSVCPDDFDNDQIIDNLDIDIDNDGVLNCDESLGNVQLNLTDTSNPILNFQDGTTNTTFANGAITSSSTSGNTNTITTDSDGNFTTLVNSAIEAELSYRIDFQQSVNIKFQETTGYVHNSVDGETFSIIIGPSEQNITLLDPDNTILVDTDFDGVFEAGITNFSTSEIRFRYNPTPNGNTPFQFVASKIDYVIFRHQLVNTTNQSTFQGNISLTCFALDSDGDGNEDSFDLDSDNDGIPDLIEMTGSLISLSDNDSDNDGLDDIFNGIGLNPADTDSDGVPDYLDLDSDNDGIFDLFEANHNLPDNNLDGVIDNADTSSGSNGLIDALETLPDSFELNYIIGNADNDNLINATELDSDNDLCLDVIEAGFTDVDNDGLIGNSPLQVDANGKALNTIDGFTVPSQNYTIGAPLVINNPFSDVTFCERSISTITIDSSADQFQWEFSTDGNSWTDLQNNEVYSGVNSNTLILTSIPLSYNNYQYRVSLGRTGNSCGLTTNSIRLTVDPLPNVGTLENIELCVEADNLGINGFAQNIDLEQQTPIVLGAQDPNNFSVSYHTTQEDADLGINPLTSPFNNTVAFQQTIYVRVQNLTTLCFNTDNSFDIIVNTNPIINRVDNLEFCDNMLDGDDTNGFVQDINLDTQTTSILGVNQSTIDFSVTFYETLEDANSEINPISSPYNNTIANMQDIYVRVENNNTGCFNTALAFQLIVNSLPEFEVTSPQYICIEDMNLSLGVENPADTYDYFWIDADGNTVLGETMNATKPGIYSVTATKLDGSNCSRTRDIVVITSGLATITEEDVIIDDGDNDNSILINNNNGNLGLGNYEFALLDIDGNFVYSYQDEPFFGNLPGGIYTILVRDKNGCGEAELEVAVIELPKFFTPNDDGINDTWNVKGVNTDFFPRSKISVFDRYGKFIADFTIDQPGWNGRYNGQVVISNDYWVRVELIDRNGKVRVETQNFALLRR